MSIKSTVNFNERPSTIYARLSQISKFWQSQITQNDLQHISRYSLIKNQSKRFAFDSKTQICLIPYPAGAPST